MYALRALDLWFGAQNFHDDWLMLTTTTMMIMVCSILRLNRSMSLSVSLSQMLGTWGEQSSSGKVTSWSTRALSGEGEYLVAMPNAVPRETDTSPLWKHILSVCVCVGGGGVGGGDGVRNHKPDISAPPLSEPHPAGVFYWRCQLLDSPTHQS